MNTILFIDSTKTDSLEVVILRGEKKYKSTQKYFTRKSQLLLPMINKLLQKNSLSPKDLSAIEINTGPGSFTGIRVGLAVANTLAITLNIPINNLPVGIQTEPVYT